MSKPGKAMVKMPPEVEEIESLLKATSKARPKPEDIARLQKWLDDVPELWMIAGDLTKIVSARIIDSIAESEMIRQSIKKGVEVLRNEMGYQTASQLERLLIDQVMLCWLLMHKIE